MKILYIGQKGIPAMRPKTSDDAILPERRVEALSASLSAKGHQVVVTCARPYVTKNLRNYNGVKLQHNFSLNPNKSGGWIHDLFSLWTLWRTQPGAVHIHGWRLAALAPLAVICSPESTYVWTVESIPLWPAWLVKLALKQAYSLFDAITVPTRQLQYQMLQEYKIYTAYIPDGYFASSVPLLPVRKLGIKTSFYNVLSIDTPKQLRVIARAYKLAGIKKKLVVTQEAKGAFKRAAKDFPFLHFVGDLQGRPLRSLLAKSTLTILSGANITLKTILNAMNAGRPIIATTDIKYQETIGVSAWYAKPNDYQGLTRLLKVLANSPTYQTALGKKAAKRAQAHFTWSRILPEYLEMYHYPLLKPVPIDSVVKTRLQELKT